MAMYYQGGLEIQSDGLQRVYLMNPNYVGNSDHHTNMLFLNSAGATSSIALNSTPVTFTPLLNSHHQVTSSPQSHDHNYPSSVIGDQQLIQGLANNMIQRFGYNSWAGSVDDQENENRNQPNMAQPTTQGLSLSLATNQTGFNNMSSGNTSGSMESVILGSKYRKAAQELLDEVVNVGKNIKDDQESKDKTKVMKDSDSDSKIEVSKGGGELTTAQRQEIQMKKAKLISMLDEVEHGYRQYNVQMQIIVESFEQAAGVGSAKSYTRLALKTISKQFRCLKDAISTQINNLSKTLGEEGRFEGSKLKYIDNQLRQHRALQQLGMVQSNAWRPQRGLPERAVSVLRSWLFEHFLHPYPKDSDKQILAKQTGLTRSQVSNWFINARVRIWKPMVEEMYMEEMKNNNQQTNTSDHDHDNTTQIPKTEPNNTTNPNQLDQTPLVTPLIFENDSKKPTNDINQVEDDSPNSMLSVETEMKGGFPTATFNGFHELNRFDPGQLATAFHGNYNNTRNTVSLTLGLPPSESSSGTTLHQQNLINFGMASEADQLVEHDDRVNNGNYEHIMLGNFQNRKPFPAQLLPDFVV